MQPAFDLRLRAMMKAVSEVVMPAIDPSNRMAVEQAGLLLGSLDLIRQQVDYAHWYEATELLSLCELGRGLLALPGYTPPAALGPCIEEGAGLARRWDLALPALRQASTDLREAISDAVELAYASSAAGLRERVQTQVLAHSQKQIERERAFVAGTQWDMFPESLRSIEDSLKDAAIKA